MTNNQQDTIDIYKTIYVLWKRKWLVLGITISLSTFLILYQSNKLPIYKATANAYSNTLDNKQMLPFFDELIQYVENKNYTALSAGLSISLENAEKINDISVYSRNTKEFIGINIKVKDKEIIPKIFNSFQLYLKEKQYIAKLADIRIANLNEQDNLLKQSLEEFEILKKRFIEEDFENQVVIYPSGLHNDQVDLLEKKNKLEELISYFSVLEYVDQPIINEKPINKKSPILLILGAFAVSCMLAYAFEFFVLLKAKFKTYEA